MSKIRLFEMFSGYGGASFALKKAGIEFECVGYSEIDKNAIKCYNQNHPGVKNYGNCTKIDPATLPDFDLLTGGFPCQAFSIAGSRKGVEDARGTLFWEIMRIAIVKKPKYMVLENVKGLLSIDDGKTFKDILATLKSSGYDVIWKVLNSKDYGVPQNRERMIFVCKLGSWDFMEFNFPNITKLTLRLKDVLESNVDKRYYLSKKQINNIMNRDKFGDHLHTDNIPDVSSSLVAIGQSDVPMIPDLQIGTLRTFKNDKQFRIMKQNNSPTITSKTPVVQTRVVATALNVALEKSLREDKPIQLDLYHLQHGEIRPLTTYIPQDGDVHRCLQAGKPKEVLVTSILDPYNNKEHFDRSPTLTEPHHNSIRVKESFTIAAQDVHGIYNGAQIRRLTPRECFRLMGFLNDEIDLTGFSDSALYKLAGNGWDVNMFSLIFRKIYKPIVFII